ncbi:MAG TPA: hypothetical protein VNN79_22955 [Actinomycetota bacterium]|nr:hypothetical protein [Actinomycetota bacterium]
MSRFRDFLTTTRGRPRAIAALLGQRLTSRVQNGLISEGGFAIDANPVKFKTTLPMYYAVAGVVKTKVATPALVFSAAHTVTANGWGAVLVQANGAAAISTKVSASPQNFATEADAKAALPALDAGKAIVAVLTIKAGRRTDGLLAIGTLAISATATKFQTTTQLSYSIGGVDYVKAATDLLVFSAAHVVTATKFGISLVQINAAGVISTKEPLATQAYADAPTALAALPAPDAGNVEVGYITIHAGVADFTMNTTALTGVSGFVDGPVGAAHDFVANTDDLSLVTTRFLEHLGEKPL